MRSTCAEKFLQENFSRRNIIFCEEFLGYPAKNCQQFCQNCLLKFCYKLVRKKIFWRRTNFSINNFGLWIRKLGFWRKVSARFPKLRFTGCKNHSGVFLKKQLTKKVFHTLSENRWSSAINGMPGCWNCSLHASRENVRRNSFSEK